MRLPGVMKKLTYSSPLGATVIINTISLDSNQLQGPMLRWQCLCRDPLHISLVLYTACRDGI
jgi:hypothetical protein